MSFSVRVAPGVRVRASRRGIRTSVGPRALRVHVGGGRPGVSTGVGPVSLYTSLGAGRRPTQRRPASSGAPRPVPGQAAAAKAAEAQRLAAVLDALLSVHREHFTPASRPLAVAPRLPDASEVQRRHERAALQGISVFRRSARAAARAQASSVAATELEAARHRASDEWAASQRHLDGLWQSLLANDPDVVLTALTEAFDDNAAAAAPLGVDGDEVSLVILAPDESVVPERMPGTTAAGNVSLRKLPKGERAALHTAAVLGHLLVTVREAFAVCPGLTTARVVVLSRPTADASDAMTCLVAGRWTRTAIDAVAWTSADAVETARSTAEELLLRLKASKQLLPLDLASEPHLKDLVALVDVVDLTA